MSVLTRGKLNGPTKEAKAMVGDEFDSPTIALTAGGLEQDVSLRVSSYPFIKAMPEKIA